MHNEHQVATQYIVETFFQGCVVARKGKQDTENLKYGSDNFPNGAWSMFRSLYII